MPESRRVPAGADDSTDATVESADVRVAAMNLLARREHSRCELRDKLSRRFGQAEIIDEQLQRLAQENLQSDARFAESYVRQSSERGYGPARLTAELRERGVAEGDILDALADAETDWWALASRVVEKKFGQAPATDLRDKSRRLRFLQYRGFTSVHYRHLLDD